MVFKISQNEDAVTFLVMKRYVIQMCPDVLVWQ